jgi:hypothetical protein
VKSNTSVQCNGHDLGADYGDAVGTNSGCGKIQNSGVPTTVDPYAGLATNILTNTCIGFYPQVPFLFVSTWSGTKALSGNVKICGDLKLTGNVTVNAPSGAVLVIDNGRLDLSGFTSQTSSGSGLTVLFTGSSGGGDIHVPHGQWHPRYRRPDLGSLVRCRDLPGARSDFRCESFRRQEQFHMEHHRPRLPTPCERQLQRAGK